MRSQSISIDGRSFIVAAVVLVVASGCKKAVDDRAAAGSPDTLAPPSAIEACRPPGTVRGMARGRFIAWAQSLDYHDPDPDRGMASNFDASDTVRVHAAYGMDTVSRADLARGCVIARIISRGADAAFGIAADTAYVWADSTNPFTATIIPDNGTPGVVYNMDVSATGPPPAGTAAVPKHVCSECGRSDWCVYPRDEIRVTEEMLVGTASMPSVIGGEAVLLSSAVFPR